MGRTSELARHRREVAHGGGHRGDLRRPRAAATADQPRALPDHLPRDLGEIIRRGVVQEAALVIPRITGVRVGGKELVRRDRDVFQQARAWRAGR